MTIVVTGIFAFYINYGSRWINISANKSMYGCRWLAFIKYNIERWFDDELKYFSWSFKSLFISLSASSMSVS